MPELEAKISFEIRCAHCGFGLCPITSVEKDNTVKVMPCPRCLKTAQQEGYDDGYKDGHATGMDDGVEAASR